MSNLAPRRRTAADAPPRRFVLMLVCLVVVLAVYAATRPMRIRLQRETTTINRQAVAVEGAIAQSKQLSKRLRDAQRRAAERPTDFTAWMDLEDLEVQIGHYLEAARALHTAEILNPSSAAPHLSFARLYDTLRMPDLVVYEYLAALKVSPGDEDAVLALAYKYVTFGWNQVATEFLNRHAKALKNPARVHAAIALAAYQTADFKDAEREILIAQRLEPGNAALTGPLIEIYRKSGRLAQALKLAESPAETSTEPIAMLLEKSQILLDMSRPASAFGAARQALMLQPASSQALYDRALAERDLGQRAAYQKDLETLLKSAPDTGQTLYLLGRLYLEQGQTARGKELLRRSEESQRSSDYLNSLTLQVAYHPNSAAAHLAMGQFQQSQKDYGRAIVEYKRALEIDPANAAARTGLKVSLRAAGRTQEADAIPAGGVYHPLQRLTEG